MAMAGIKSKNHALNLRRTYDVFKEPTKSRIGDKDDRETVNLDARETEGAKVEQG
jgi:hypothetical protein